MLSVTKGRNWLSRSTRPCSPLAKSSALGVTPALAPAPEKFLFPLGPSPLASGVCGARRWECPNATLLLLGMPSGAGDCNENSRNKRDKRLQGVLSPPSLQSWPQGHLPLSPTLPSSSPCSSSHLEVAQCWNTECWNNGCWSTECCNTECWNKAAASLEREFIYPFLCWHCWALVPCMSSHTVMGAVIYPHGSTVGAREGLSQLLYGPSALKIAFICLLTLSL